MEIADDLSVSAIVSSERGPVSDVLPLVSTGSVSFSLDKLGSGVSKIFVPWYWVPRRVGMTVCGIFEAGSYG